MCTSAHTRSRSLHDVSCANNNRLAVVICFRLAFLCWLPFFYHKDPYRVRFSCFYILLGVRYQHLCDFSHFQKSKFSNFLRNPEALSADLKQTTTATRLLFAQDTS